MLDIGWSELLLIGIVALIVVGPKELPGLFRTVGLYVGKARGMAREFQRSMEQAARESGLDEATGGLKNLNRLNLNSATHSARKYAETLVNPKDLSLEPLPEEGKAKPAAEPAGAEAAAPAAAGGDAAETGGSSSSGAPAEAGAARP